MAEGGETFQQTAGTKGSDEVPGLVISQFCQPCSNNSKESAAALFCQTCNEFQCKDCSNGHNVYSFMKNHKLVDATTASRKVVVYDMNGLDRCDRHDKLVEFFCDDDKKLCCSTCAITKHRKCNILFEIKETYAKERNIDLALKVKLMERMERCRAAAIHWTGSEQHVQEQVKDLFKRFDSVRTSVNKRLDELEGGMKSKTAALSKMKAKEYRNNCALSEEALTILEHDLELLDKVNLKGTPEQIFIAQQRINEYLGTMDEKSSKLPKLKYIEMSLEICNELTQLVDAGTKLGSLKINTKEREIDDIIEGRPVTLEKVVSINMEKYKYDDQDPLITGMDFFSDGRLVVVDNRNTKFLIYNARLEQLDSCKLSSYPLSIVAVSEDEVAVTFGNLIDLFNVSSCNKVTWTRRIRTTSHYGSICMMSADHFVVGTYDDMKPVRMVSLSGKEKDFDIYFPSKKFSLSASDCTYIKNSKKVVLSDQMEHTIYIYDIMTNTRIVVKDDHIRDPTGVAIGPYGSIFVCSFSSASIIQISPTGRILSSHNLDMYLPYRVCVSKDKTRLAVISNPAFAGQHKLQLFNIRL